MFTIFIFVRIIGIGKSNSRYRASITYPNTDYIKSKMKNRRLIFAMLVILVAGCAKENELKKSVLIYDSEYTDLPAYTEWGYNTFGAYYDRQIFISNNETVPAKVIVSKGRMSFVLGGQNGITKYYSDPFKKMTMTFELAGFTPGTYTNLIVLN